VAALGPAAAVAVRALLAQRTLLEEQSATGDAAIGAVMATVEQHLTSIPGVGPVLAATSLAELGDGSRCARLEAVVASAGLDPSVFESGQVQGRRRPLATRGSPSRRRALVLAAHSAQVHTADRRTSLERKRAAGKPDRAAVIAVAHTLLARCYVVLKERRPYQPR